MTTKLSLGSRLFFSHLLVMVVGLSTFITIAKLSSPRMFVLRLEQLERQGFFTVRSARTYLVKGFETAWDTSTLWSLLAGGTAAGYLSFWLSKRIVKPLKQMENITQKFASGELEERMPDSEIPELHQLGVSFNRMATSLDNVENRRRELMSDLTHELRTPLTVVRGYLEELADGSISPSTELYQNLIKYLENRAQELEKNGAEESPEYKREDKIILDLITTYQLNTGATVVAQVPPVNPEVIFCNHCGAKNPTAAKFCSSCGQKL